MPIFNVTVKDSERSMIEPITKQLIDKVLRYIGAGKLFDGNIYINSDNFKSSSQTDKNHRPTISTDRCVVNMDYTLNPENSKWEALKSKQILATGISARHKLEDFPIFRDARPDITLKEYQRPCTIRAEVELHVKSADMADNFISAILNRYHTGSLTEYQDIYFSYSMDTTLMVLLYQFYKLREFEEGYTFSFLEYLQTCSVGEISFAKNRSATDTRLEILKNKQQILTELTFSDDKAEVNLYERYPDVHVVKFTYTIQFNKPTSITAFYPVVIDNQLIPKLARPVPKPVQPAPDESVVTDVAFNKYIYKSYTNKYPQPIKRLPDFDDWNVPQNSHIKRSGYREFLIVAMTLDFDEEDNAITQIDLMNDLTNDFVLHPIITDALKIQGADSFGTHGLFNISIYANDVVIDKEQLTMSDELVITLAAEVKYLRYHLVISEVWKLNTINSHYVPILFHYANFFNMTIVRNIDRLVKAGELIWKKGFVYIDKTTKLRLPDGSYITLDGDDVSVEMHGVDYSALEGYGEITDNYLITKRGYPILTGGSSNGVNHIWRCGEYVIKSISN